MICKIKPCNITSRSLIIAWLSERIKPTAQIKSVQYLVSACIISKFLAVAYKIKRSKKKNAFMLQLKIYHK